MGEANEARGVVETIETAEAGSVLSHGLVYRRTQILTVVSTCPCPGAPVHPAPYPSRSLARRKSAALLHWQPSVSLNPSSPPLHGRKA